MNKYNDQLIAFSNADDSQITPIVFLIGEQLNRVPTWTGNLWLYN